MGGDGDEGGVATGFEGCDDIAGAIDFSVPFEVAKTGGDPFGALLFKKCGRGDAAELEMLIENPGTLAAEPIESGAHAGCGGKVGDGLSERRQVLVYTRVWRGCWGYNSSELALCHWFPSKTNFRS